MGAAGAGLEAPGLAIRCRALSALQAALRCHADSEVHGYVVG